MRNEVTGGCSVSADCHYSELVKLFSRMTSQQEVAKCQCLSENINT